MARADVRPPGGQSLVQAAEKRKGNTMDVRVALVADAANISREGKLNVLGVFDRISASAFPAVHGAMALIVQFECGPAEWETTKKVEVKLLDEDAHLIFGLASDLDVPRGETGRPVQIANVINLNGVRFEKPGQYRFDVLVNGETKAQVPIALFAAKPATQANEP